MPGQLANLVLNLVEEVVSFSFASVISQVLVMEVQIVPDLKCKLYRAMNNFVLVFLLEIGSATNI